MQAIVRSVLMLSVAASIAACGGLPSRQQTLQRQADYAAAAGAAVNSFPLYGPLTSWEALGQDRVVVYTQPNRAWLLEVPGCRDLDFATAIGLTSRMGQVSVHFDKVLTGRHDFPCFIAGIRAVDLQRFRLLQKAPPRHPEAGG